MLHRSCVWSSHVQAQARLDWNCNPGDHALISFECGAGAKPYHKWLPSTFRPPDTMLAWQVAREVVPNDFVDFDHLRKVVHKLQDLTGDSRPCSVKKAERETEAMKCLRLELRGHDFDAATGLAKRKALHVLRREFVAAKKNGRHSWRFERQTFQKVEEIVSNTWRPATYSRWRFGHR